MDNIKMDVEETLRSGMDWIDMAEVRGKWMALSKAVAKLRIP
jgi:hypothetical protein